MDSLPHIMGFLSNLPIVPTAIVGALGGIAWGTFDTFKAKRQIGSSAGFTILEQFFRTGIAIMVALVQLERLAGHPGADLSVPIGITASLLGVSAGYILGTCIVFSTRGLVNR